jgi:hypothetical protein
MKETSSDMDFTTLWETQCLISNFFLQLSLFSFSFDFVIISSMEANLEFVSLQLVVAR